MNELYELTETLNHLIRQESIIDKGRDVINGDGKKKYEILKLLYTKLRRLRLACENTRQYSMGEFIDNSRVMEEVKDEVDSELGGNYFNILIRRELSDKDIKKLASNLKRVPTLDKNILSIIENQIFKVGEFDIKKDKEYRIKEYNRQNQKSDYERESQRRRDEEEEEERQRQREYDSQPDIDPVNGWKRPPQWR